jgi:hypothetical protein
LRLVFGSNLNGDVGYPEAFRGFPHSLQTNVVIVLRLSQDNFLINLFRFFYHPTLYNLRTYCVLKLIKNMWNPKFHYCVHKGMQLASILNRLIPVYTFTLFFLELMFSFAEHKILLAAQCVLFHTVAEISVVLSTQNDVNM